MKQWPSFKELPVPPFCIEKQMWENQLVYFMNRSYFEL